MCACVKYGAYVCIYMCVCVCAAHLNLRGYQRQRRMSYCRISGVQQESHNTQPSSGRGERRKIWATIQILVINAFFLHLYTSCLLLLH